LFKELLSGSKDYIRSIGPGSINNRKRSDQAEQRLGAVVAPPNGECSLARGTEFNLAAQRSPIADPASKRLRNQHNELPF
jgi:hypothetical protein